MPNQIAEREFGVLDPCTRKPQSKSRNEHEFCQPLLILRSQVLEATIHGLLTANRWSPSSTPMPRLENTQYYKKKMNSMSRPPGEPTGKCSDADKLLARSKPGGLSVRRTGAMLNFVEVLL